VALVEKYNLLDNLDSILYIKWVMELISL
jgi:hypothetical protein